MPAVVKLPRLKPFGSLCAGICYIGLRQDLQKLDLTDGRIIVRLDLNHQLCADLGGSLSRRLYELHLRRVISKRDNIVRLPLPREAVHGSNVQLVAIGFFDHKFCMPGTGPLLGSIRGPILEGQRLFAAVVENQLPLAQGLGEVDLQLDVRAS